ncbi:MAG TPA: adenylate cyclase regulatory domain-containing protein, partial [Thermoleophilaceae bacterium]|nr:adenylate cyclase regulatory domain-containing protein [Thermoleophilaceae bacterium]
LELLERLHQSLGLPRFELDQRMFAEDDLEAARTARRLLDAELPADGLLEVARVIGRAIETVAAASRELVGSALLKAGDTELDVARRYASAAAELGPLMGSLLDYQYRTRLREGLRREAAVPPEALEAGELPGAVEVAVGFADLVDFTRLGEQLPAEDVGRVAGRLAEMADEVAEEPVRLVKTIGDAAMLVSTETAPLVDALLALVERSQAEGEDIPQLHAGAARGIALGRAGDWYGRPVNLASRVAEMARPGSVLVEAGVRDAIRAELGLADEGQGSGEEARDEGDEGSEGGTEGHREGGDAGEPYRWSRAGRRRIKGVEDRVSLYRVRPAGNGAG